MVQYYLRHFYPSFCGILTRLIYFGSNIKFGKNFKCDSIPRILIDKGCQIRVGNNVEFRRSLEIRSHGNSQVIIGDNVRVDRGVRILAANEAQINIGSKVRIGLYSVFNGGDSITIGNKSLVSGFVYLQTSMHGHAQRELSVQDQGYKHAPVVLEQDVWLGTHVVILPGVTLSQGVVVGSNAVVTKSVAAFTVVGGIPAKELKER